MNNKLYRDGCNEFMSGLLEFVVTPSEANRFLAFAMDSKICKSEGVNLRSPNRPFIAWFNPYRSVMYTSLVYDTPYRGVRRIAFAEMYDLEEENAAAAKMIKLMEKPMVVPTNDDWAKAKEWGADVHIRRQKAKDLLAEVVAAQSLLESIFKALTEFVQQTGSL